MHDADFRLEYCHTNSPLFLGHSIGTGTPNLTPPGMKMRASVHTYMRCGAFAASADFVILL